MEIFGYAADDNESAEFIIPSKLAEITLVANPNELRLIAKFIESCANGIEERGSKWEHEHLSDSCKQFENAPHFIVFNPDAQP